MQRVVFENKFVSVEIAPTDSIVTHIYKQSEGWHYCFLDDLFLVCHSERGMPMTSKCYMLRNLDSISITKTDKKTIFKIKN